MKYLEMHLPLENYVAPFARIVNLRLDQSFLASNLEPIDGGNDPDIDW